MRSSQNKKLTLSIVIPAFNEESYLQFCLDSIAAQDILPDEVIVVDNNSTDSTKKIAQSYPFVKYVIEKKQGVFYASTKGFRLANGDIIARIDSDSILPVDWVEKIKAAFSGDVHAVTGPVHYYDMPFGFANHWFDHAMRYWTYKYAKDTPFLYGSNMAVSRNSWLEVQPELCKDRDLHEDVDLAVHLHEHGYKILYSRQFLAAASGRRYNDSLSNFLGYVMMYKRNFTKHNLRTWPTYPGIFMWCLGYVIMYPIRSVWYSYYKWSSKEYPLSAVARKNPMSS